MPKLIRCLAPVAVFALVATACGGDGEEPSEPSGEPTGPTADLATFCAAAVDAEAAVVSGAPPEEVEAVLADFEGSAPEELRESVELVVSAVRGGEPAAFDSPQFAEADEAIDRYVIDSCGYEVAEISGVDFAFEGVPETLPAGRVGLDFTNDGEELHEMVLLRINDGVEESFEELLQLPQEEATEKATFIAAAFGPPGARDAEVVDLEAGRYGMACFIPVGTTSEEEQGDGPPHFAEGMLAELTVE